MTGDNARMVGGLRGYAGRYADEVYGIPVTTVSRFRVNNVEIATGKNSAASVSGLMGGGFYLDEMASIGAPYDAPTVFNIADCTVSTTVNGEEAAVTGEMQEQETNSN